MNGKYEIYQGSTNNKGYGTIWINGYPELAHRVSYKLHKGKPIPKGKQVRHLCGNKLCINPNHLEVGTQLDNEQDKKAHGTWGRNQWTGPAIRQTDPNKL